MKNREIFQRDPVVNKLLNDGVAAVSEALSEKEITTLRYELEHFVCEGQYKDGLVRILESFLGNVDSTVQPAGWISGFYGSGKSHLEKMLRHLWLDTSFSDGATARGLARLPQDVKDLLKELTTLGKRCGGLHAAAGTLPSGGGNSVRLTVLGLLFRSRGLPETLPQARFCLWLQKEGIFDRVIKAVETAKKDFFRELRDLYVSPVLAKALLEADSGFAPDEKQARATLRAQFPVVTDVSTSEFITLVREVLAQNGKIPATIIVLDEVQLFIGDSAQRSTDVQEVAEAICKQLDSRVMLIGAGQTALAGSVPLLQRLRGRFTIPVELSDIDVETVTRRVVLAKRADKIKDVQDCLLIHAGEIDRQLAGTLIATRSEDRMIAFEDYPLLPVRRRFWERVLQAVDAPGTAAQLRTQLRIVHDAVAEIADEPLGSVVPADFIVDQLQPDLLRTGIMLKEIDEMIRRLDDGTPGGKLARRLCGLIFLIRKLPREAGIDCGVRATPEMLADLLVRDLAHDGSRLRKEIPPILEKLVQEGKLIRLDDGFGLQTRESSEWDREFRNRQSRLLGDGTGVASKRATLISAEVGKVIGGISLRQGKSKEPRKLLLHFGEQPPPSKGRDIPVWVRDEWGESEKNAIGDARSAGPESPIIFVFVPKASAEDLKRAIIDFEAAKSAIDFKGIPSTPEGREAREAMASRMREAESRRNEVMGQVIEAARVFQGGGAEVFALTLAEKVRTAAEASLDRLFPNFRDADHERWDTVINRARHGDENALEAIGFKDKPLRHQVCSAALSLIGSGKRGKEIRNAFEGSPYGWPRDAVDAALIVLHTTGHLRVTYNGSPLTSGQLDQAKISTADFRTETTSLDATQKIKLRKLFQAVGINCKPGEESGQASPFLTKVLELAHRSGGDAPLPTPPVTRDLEDLRSLSGNEQLLAILNLAEQISDKIKEWRAIEDLIAIRLPVWKTLTRMIGHLKDLPREIVRDPCCPGSKNDPAHHVPAVDGLMAQIEAIQVGRLLLEGADSAPTILKTGAKVLREAINAVAKEYRTIFERESAALMKHETWKRLDPSQQQSILHDQRLETPRDLDVSDDEALLVTLEACSLNAWKTKIQALPQQFNAALLAAAQLLEPKAQHVRLSRATLRSPEDVKSWISKTEQELLKHLQKGPVVIS